VSLRFRLLAVVGLTFAVVVVGCVYAAHLSASHELRAQADRFLLQRSNDRRIQDGTHFDRNFGGRGFNTPPPFAEPDALVQIIRPDGSVYLPSSPSLPVDKHDVAVATGDVSHSFRDVHVGDDDYRMLTTHVDGGAAQIAREIGSVNDVMSSLDWRLVSIALAGTILATLLAWIIARRIVRPVEQLTHATEHVASTQDLTDTITVERRDELGRLASSFNTMLVALRNSRDQQKRLVMDASHELRTPLTALRTNIEVLKRTASLDDDQRAELLSQVDVELVELTELVSELVDLATDARAEEPVQSTELAPLAEDVAERFRRRTGREIRFDAHDPATVNVRPGGIERAISNLVDNACKFSAAPAPIDVCVRGSVVEVGDHGLGIDDGDRELVFDRFYRSPAARTMPGSGLGLSIVRQIAQLHGGTVELLARDGGGTVARLSLPSAP
jgi:two-component system sensor histidine kinase MprB